MRERQKSAGRKGQRKGQLAALAAQHNVSTRWLLRMATGTLDDPVFIRAVRAAAKRKRRWQFVAPAVQAALAIPTVKIERLGGSLDDLLGMLLESADALQDPSNRRFAAQPGAALAHVNMSLDLLLAAKREADADRGQRSLASTDHAREKKADVADERAARFLSELASRKGTKSAAHIRIAAAETKTTGKKVTADAVKAVIKNYLNRQKRKGQTRKK